MPPKRKQMDESAAEAGTSTRSTRASTRTTTTKTTTTAKKTSSKKAATNVVDEDSDATESVRSAKKARTAPPKKATTKGGRKKANKDDPEPDAPRKPSSIKGVIQSKPVKTNDGPVSVPVSIPKLVPQPQPSKPLSPTKPVQRPISPPAMAHASTASGKKTGKVEPYTAQRALELFNKYEDTDVSDTIGPEGFQQLCEDAEMPMEGARPLIFAWQVDSKEMGKITKDEWVKAMATFKIASIPAISKAMSDLEELLFREKAPKDAGKDYDKAALSVHTSNPKASFQKLYMFSFNLVKPPQSKNIDMETSVAFWSALLVPKYPLMGEIIEFINAHKTSYKATNKDLWSMMLEFLETVKPTLQDYEADGAWPTLLDDFVASKNNQSANGNGAAKADNMDEN